MGRFKFERFIPASACATKNAAIDSLFPEVDGDLTTEYRKPSMHPTDDECICAVDERLLLLTDALSTEDKLTYYADYDSGLLTYPEVMALGYFPVE